MWMVRLQVVVVDLEGAVRAAPGEPDHVVLVVVDLDPDLPDRVVVRAHVVHGEDVALDLWA